MAAVFVQEALAHLVPVLWRDRDVLEGYGLGFGEVVECRGRPRDVRAEDFVLWQGTPAWLPRLARGMTGRIRSRKTGSHGLVQARRGEDFGLLMSRWDEVEAAGDDLLFAGSVSEREQGEDELDWVIARLERGHSHSLHRPADWGRLARLARRRLEAAATQAEHLRAWEWLLAHLHDNHTKVVGVQGPSACSRVHCGLYGRFVGPSCLAIERVFAGSAAESAGLAPGDEVLSADGLDWPAYLRRERAFWAFSSPHLRRAAQRFIPWYQPAGTRLELNTRRGRRTIEFAGESYCGFAHWAYEGTPEPMTFERCGPDRYRLRITYFPGGEEFVGQCREALGAVPADGVLELDLRGCGGGNGVNASKVAGMLLPEGTPLSRRRGRRVGGGFTRWTVCRSRELQVYGGPLVVLMDEFCGSATEGVIGALKSAGRARLVGRRTGGSSGNPRRYVSPGGVMFTCSSWEETTPEGEPIEGHGITTRKW